MERFKLELNSQMQELVIREGAAPDNFKVRKPIVIDGNIEVPYQHLEKQSSTIICELGQIQIQSLSDVIDESFLTIDAEYMQIKFIENAGKDYESIYTGKLEFDTVFKDLGINNNQVSYTPLALSEILKRYRSFFESKTEAMKLVSTLRDFEAKVNKEVEAKVDERANRRVLLAQTVTTNIPEGFKMKIPIFKGLDAVLFEIEISIDPINLNCLLVSPEANDLVLQTKNELLKEQESKIRALHEDLRIFWI